MQNHHCSSRTFPLGTLVTRLVTVLALATLLATPMQATPGPATPGQGDQRVAHIEAKGSTLTFEPVLQYESVVLSVTGPQQIHTEALHQAGDGFTWSLFDSEGEARPDGTYTYQLRVNPEIDAETRRELAAARLADRSDEVSRRLYKEGRLPEGPIVQSGYFQVAGGEIIFGGATETPQRAARTETASDGAGASPDKQLITGDLTVRNSLCVGFDCLHPETFGSDTVRLKENNLRVHFDDTSTGNFPATDWRILINDESSGGGSYFGVVDATVSRRIFTLEASAPTHSLFVDDGGRVGLGTSTPSVELHVVDGDSPTLRLNQDGSSGFQQQAWDLAGNETSLFIRDVTNGSTLPFRIFPGNASNVLTLNNDNVGIGTTNPDEDLHIIRNSIPIGVKFENGADNRNWTFKLSGSGFAINEDAEASTLLLRDNGEMRVGNNGSPEFVVRSNGDTEIDGDLDVDGNITATGTISDRDRKQQIVDVDRADVLAKVLALPVSTWVYDHQTEVRHIGPMAQDFHAAFGLGTERSIGLTDLGGLSLAAIQELNAQLNTQLEASRQDAQAKQVRIEQLEQRMEALEAAFLALQQQ